jgi:thiol-disulfide isomerase/thioredoxin
MTMKSWMLAGALVLLAGAAGAVQDAAAPTLKVGDKAPPLDHVNWIKGEPVKAWEAGHVYVIDFWATWCGPCRASIPHVNELAKQHAADNVTVIGAAIWPKPKMVPTADFVKEKGDAMSYLIAEDIDGATATAFMAASGNNGIPTAMVIDKQGTIAWMGHPMDGLDTVIAHVVKGDYDPQAALALNAKADAIKTELETARKAQDWAKCATLADQVLTLDPARFGDFGVYSYRFRIVAGDKDGAATYGRQLVNGAFKDVPDALNMLGWQIVDPDSADPAEARDLDLALLASQRADELRNGKDPNVIDTVARVWFLKGDINQAVTLQQKAVDLASDAGQKRDLQKRLDEYTAAKS